MMSSTLACGPYFHEDSLAISSILLFILKPLAYFAFIQSFRYRVSRPIPMRFRQAFKLTAFRAGLGIVFMAMGVLILFISQNETVLLVSWVYLYGERLFSWWAVGSKGAGIRGRRLVGWVISGTLINAAFDAAMVFGLFSGWKWPLFICAAIAGFIGLLHVIGRRMSLRLKFSPLPLCHQCRYDLTGNLSGRCPECGTAISYANVMSVQTSPAQS